MVNKNNAWHFGGQRCAQCEYSKRLHTGCAKTKTNFRLWVKEDDQKKKEEK